MAGSVEQTIILWFWKEQFVFSENNPFPFTPGNEKIFFSNSLAFSYTLKYYKD